MVAAYDYSRVSLPDTGSPPIHAAAATITRRLGPGLAARHLAAQLRRRQAPFARAAEDLSTAGADLLPPSPSACGPCT